MRLTRRSVLGTAAAAAAFGGLARAEPAPQVLRAQAGRQQIAPNGFAETDIWGYGGAVPGPEFRTMQGARFRRRLINDLPQPTTVHWHGVRIANAMDGVPGLTQEAVQAGDRFDYDFAPPDAGTFWYHSHNKNVEQVARGLYGPLIVEENAPPEVDADLALMIDDWRLDTRTMAITGDFDNRHDLSHAGRLGNITTVNGHFDPVQSVRRHDRLRLRLINAANARVFEIGFEGLEGWLVALDGMPLQTPAPVTGAFRLAPAQRADVIVDVTAKAEAHLLSIERDGGYGLMRFAVQPGPRVRRDNAPSALPPNPMPAIAEPAAAPLTEMRMTGGAMRGLEPSQLGTTLMQPRELYELGKFWALAGQVDRGPAPFVDAARGETHRISFVNDTAFGHAMHTHGHHFRTLRADGSLGPWRDTLLIDPGETRQVVMVADNPGNWLLHCHMLGHAAAGMMNWFRVT